MSNPSVSNAFVDIFAAPRDAFASLKEKPRFLWALLLLMTGVGLVQFLYLNGVDIEWFYEQQLAARPDMTDAQVEQSVRFLTSFPQAALAAVGVVGGALSIAIVMLVQALYFRIVSAITRDGLSYKRLFTLVCWSSIPTVLSSLAQIVNLVVSDVSLMPPTRVNPLAFWGLLNLEPMGAGTFDTILMSYDPITVWALALLILGYRVFSGKDWTSATLIALLPTAVVFSLAFIF